MDAAWVVCEVAIPVYMARLLAGEPRGADALVRLATRMGEGDLTARADRGARRGQRGAGGAPRAWRTP